MFFVSITKEKNRYSVYPVVRKTFHMMVMCFSTMWKLSLFPPSLFSSKLALWIAINEYETCQQRLSTHSNLCFSEFFAFNLSSWIRICGEVISSYHLSQISATLNTHALVTIKNLLIRTFCDVIPIVPYFLQMSHFASTLLEHNSVLDLFTIKLFMSALDLLFFVSFMYRYYYGTFGHTCINSYHLCYSREMFCAPWSWSGWSDFSPARIL